MDSEYIDAVRALVRRIPPGRAMTYGLIAEVVADQLIAAGGVGRGGPRQVGRIMAAGDGDWPWWRVVNAAGSPPAHYAERALAALRAESTPLTADGTRVALRRAVWFPEQD
ncbi:MGMT family protein [Cellulomonas sp. NPDC089187]|uniref:MGMT family protein n=1 Tax=Cellulomonas sp. NPDC089187 TaxID=3154970 RepID=UPI003444E088